MSIFGFPFPIIVISRSCGAAPPLGKNTNHLKPLPKRPGRYPLAHGLLLAFSQTLQGRSPEWKTIWAMILRIARKIRGIDDSIKARKGLMKEGLTCFLIASL